MAKLSLKTIIDIQVNLAAKAAKRKGFNMALILGKSNVIPESERVRIYTSTDALIEDGFKPDSAEYKAAKLYFSATLAPSRLAVGVQVTKDKDKLAAAQACRAANGEWYVLIPLGATDKEIEALADWVENAQPDTLLAYTTSSKNNLSNSQEDAGEEKTGIFEKLKKKSYSVFTYEGTQPKIIWKVEHYTTGGIRRYIYTDSKKLIPDVEQTDADYLTVNGEPFNWDRVPLIAFKYNNREIPLINRVKCLQDALNELLSNYSDNMAEDIRSTILILEGYEGEDLSEFRRNLIAYGVIKVGTEDRKGDVRTLSIEVNADNYDLIIKLLKKAIIENGHGFDAKDDRMSNNPNQINIRSIYSDIDLDANNMEMEFQASLEQLMWFVNTFLRISGTNPDKNKVEFIFNRDTPVNESEVIQNCKNSVGIISKETIVANHPWTKDTAEELARLEKENTEALMPDYAANEPDGTEE